MEGGVRESRGRGGAEKEGGDGQGEIQREAEGGEIGRMGRQERDRGGGTDKQTDRGINRRYSQY